MTSLHLMPPRMRFGAASATCLYAVPVGARVKYLPIGEVQKGAEDFQDCVSRKTINILETKFNYALRCGLILPENVKWLCENGYIVVRDGVEYVEFSDAWIAIKSGTTRAGNSLKAPADAAYRFGLVPKKMLPAAPNMTFDMYHDPRRITREIEDVAAEFQRRWDINYEMVMLKDLEAVLEGDLCGVAVFAWPAPVKGEYPRTDGPFGHDCMAFATPKTYVFDNYLDEGRAQDFIKKLAPDYNIYEHNYRIFVSAERTSAERDGFFAKQLSDWLGILSGLLKILQSFRDFTAREREAREEAKPTPIPEKADPRLELLATAKAFLGKRALTGLSIAGIAPKEFSCADSLTNVLRSAFGKDFIRPEVSTITLNALLKAHKGFRGVMDLEPGCVIISPTEGSKTGHCGVILENGRIASNTSANGLWEDNYSIEGWVAYFRRKQGLRIFVYKPI